jgi:hypothetical protein
MIPRFDPTRAIVYDLGRGQLRDDEGNARLNLPASLVMRLCESAGEEATQDFAAALGADMGRRVRERMGSSGEAASIESWTEHLGGQLALLGFGDLVVERWGKALVLRVAGVPAEMQGLVGVLLEGALHRALGRDLRLPGFSEGDSAAYLVVSPSTAEKVYEWAASGRGLIGAIEALHNGSPLS